FSYTSYSNEEWMSIETLQEWIDKNKDKIGKI
ncbi:UDP-N-acetylglucosamine 4,6-dehydratase (inverting), partial [bacterium]|nr:UDP-N-acetylglucosamine 4,6-dehydratase (inverting) [bacterium]